MRATHGAQAQQRQSTVQEGSTMKRLILALAFALMMAGPVGSAHAAVAPPGSGSGYVFQSFTMTGQSQSQQCFCTTFTYWYSSAYYIAQDIPDVTTDFWGAGNNNGYGKSTFTGQNGYHVSVVNWDSSCYVRSYPNTTLPYCLLWRWDTYIYVTKSGWSGTCSLIVYIQVRSSDNQRSTGVLGNPDNC